MLHRWRGHRLAVATRGNGPPLVLVHAIHAAASNMEWRHVAPILAQNWRIIAVDLLGFGASDRPDVDYSADLYTDLLEHVLTDIVDAPAVVVGSSLGGTYAIRVAARRPDRVRAVIAVGPAGVTRLRTPGGPANAWVQRLFRTPRLGRRLFALLTTRRSIRFFLRDIYANRAAMTPETVDLYWRAAHQPGARFAPAAFVGMQLNCDIRADLASLSVPMLLLWGQQARQTPLKESAAFLAIRPDLAFQPVPGGDLPHDEEPQAFVAAVEGFLGQVIPSR